MSLQTVNMTQAAKFIKVALKANLVPYLAGSPGMGKSAMLHAIAKEFNLLLIDVRLAQEDPTTINGFPGIVNGRSVYQPPQRFPLEGDKLPVVMDKDGKIIHRYSGWLLLFDELPSAPKSVQAAAYKILLDRMIDNKPIHTRCAMVAAGNLLTDGAIVYDMGSALKSRLVHIHVKSNPEEFLGNVAKKINLDLRIEAYLNYQKSKVNNFDEYNKGSSDETFACERTWHMASKICHNIEPNQNKPIPHEYSVLLQGTVGSAALEFVQFTHAFDQLPTYKQIINDPTKAPVPSKPAVRWLLTSMLAGNATQADLDPLMDYVERIPKEFQFATVKMLWNKDDKFLDNEKVMDKFTQIGDTLFG